MGLDGGRCARRGVAVLGLLLWRCAASGAGRAVVGLRHEARPDARVATHLLADDEDQEGYVVCEHCVSDIGEHLRE